MLERSQNKNLPSMLKYSIHAQNQSLFNTPPTFAIYMFNLEMKWLLDQGGLDAIDAKILKKLRCFMSVLIQVKDFTRDMLIKKIDP